jgi:deoxyribonuclease V
MILAIDVFYKENSAKTVGVLFEWGDEYPAEIIIEHLANIEEYIPGEFYKRELPCILKVLEKVNLNQIDAIIIDGYVYVNNEMDHGLGGKLWEALNGTLPIIGVAKTSFYSNQDTVIKVKRGQSNNPLYVSSIGIELEQAALFVQNMKGGSQIT